MLETVRRLNSVRAQTLGLGAALGAVALAAVALIVLRRRRTVAVSAAEPATSASTPEFVTSPDSEPTKSVAPQSVEPQLAAAKPIAPEAAKPAEPEPEFVTIPEPESTEPGSDSADPEPGPESAEPETTTSDEPAELEAAPSDEPVELEAAPDDALDDEWTVVSDDSESS